MKRINETEWTDGKDIYVGNPKQGFTLKQQQSPIVDSGVVELQPMPKPEDDTAE